MGAKSYKEPPEFLSHGVESAFYFEVRDRDEAERSASRRHVTQLVLIIVGFSSFTAIALGLVFTHQGNELVEFARVAGPVLAGVLSGVSGTVLWQRRKTI